MSSGTNLNAVIARNLKFLREEQGLSVEDLAKLTHIGHSTVNEIELNKKKRAINPDYIPLFAKALRVDPDVLTESNGEIRSNFERLQEQLNSKDYGLGTEQFANVLVDCTSQRGPKERAEALHLRGQLFYNKDQYTRALDDYMAVARIAKSVALDGLEYKAKYNEATCHVRLGHYDLAVSITDECLHKISDLEYKAKILYIKAIIHKTKKQWNEAAKCLTDAVDIMPDDRSDKKTFDARCFQVLGDIYRDQGRYDDAITTSCAALEMAQDAGDAIGEIYALRTIAYVRIDKEEKTAALSDLEKLREISHAHPYVSKSEVLVNEFYTAFCMNDFVEMKRVALKIEDVEMPPKDKQKMYERLADCAMNNSNFAEAQIFYKKAIRAFA